MGTPDTYVTPHTPVGVRLNEELIREHKYGYDRPRCASVLVSMLVNTYLATVMI